MSKVFLLLYSLSFRIQVCRKIINFIHKSVKSGNQLIECLVLKWVYTIKWDRWDKI